MSSLAGNYNITADQGATFTLTIFRKDSKKRISPFEASEIRLQVRETSRIGALILEATTENGRITYSGQQARIDIEIDYNTMTSISPGSYVYDLELQYSNNIVERMIMGKFTVRGEVTR